MIQWEEDNCKDKCCDCITACPRCFFKDSLCGCHQLCCLINPCCYYENRPPPPGCACGYELLENCCFFKQLCFLIFPCMYNTTPPLCGCYQNCLDKNCSAKVLKKRCCYCDWSSEPVHNVINYNTSFTYQKYTPFISTSTSTPVTTTEPKTVISEQPKYDDMPPKKFCYKCYGSGSYTEQELEKYDLPCSNCGGGGKENIYDAHGNSAFVSCRSCGGRGTSYYPGTRTVTKTVYCSH